MTTVPAFGQAALAGHGRRIAAGLLDGVFCTVTVVAAGAAGFALGLLLAGATNADDDGWEALGWVLAGTILGALAGAVLWMVLTVWLVRRPGAHNGQTLGKQILGIRAACADHGEIGLGRTLLRETLAKGVLVGITSGVVSTVLGFIDLGLIGFAVAALLWYSPAFFDERHRALQDHLAGTCVIDARRPPAPPAIVDEPLWPTV
jgi:uncharacterized RDD family membrane protein YckC